MNRKRTAGIRRFASSAVIALSITVALLFLMTRLILPGEQDRIVTRMIRNIEFQRAVLPPDPAGIQVFELPPPIEARHDISDFARNLPMRVVCKSAPKAKFSFDRDDRD